MGYIIHARTCEVHSVSLTITDPVSHGRNAPYADYELPRGYSASSLALSAIVGTDIAPTLSAIDARSARALNARFSSTEDDVEKRETLGRCPLKTFIPKNPALRCTEAQGASEVMHRRRQDYIMLTT